MNPLSSQNQLRTTDLDQHKALDVHLCNQRGEVSIRWGVESDELLDVPRGPAATELRRLITPRFLADSEASHSHTPWQSKWRRMAAGAFFPPLKSTAEMCTDSLTLPEIDKSECSANFPRKSSPVQRRSAASHAGLQTDVHLTFQARKRPFQVFPSRNVQLALTYTFEKAEECSTAAKQEDKRIVHTCMHKQNDAHWKLYKKKAQHLLFTRKLATHCSTSLVQTNKWFPLCWKISEPGNVCFGDDGCNSKHAA